MAKRTQLMDRYKSIKAADTIVVLMGWTCYLTIYYGRIQSSRLVSLCQKSSGSNLTLRAPSVEGVGLATVAGAARTGVLTGSAAGLSLPNCTGPVSVLSSPSGVPAWPSTLRASSLGVALIAFPPPD